MRDRVALEKEIRQLIDSGREGAYWDFKRQHYHDKGDLLHDILCMANNLQNRDAYIIIGVEDKTKQLWSVEGDPDRKTQQNLIDFVQRMPFYGQDKPDVELYTFTIDGAVIDVILIANGERTPYFLAEPYKGILPYYVYTRKGDTNTPINQYASVHDVEFLWKKRFGLV